MRFLSIVALIEFIDAMERGGFTSSLSINEVKQVFKLINVPISHYFVSVWVNEKEITMTFVNNKFKNTNEKLYIPLAITFRIGGND